jgi:hypothetical protein
VWRWTGYGARLRLIPRGWGCCGWTRGEGRTLGTAVRSLGAGGMVPLGLLVPAGDEPAGGAVVRRCCSAEVGRGRGRGAGSGGKPATAWGGVAVAVRVRGLARQTLTVLLWEGTDS